MTENGPAPDRDEEIELGPLGDSMGFLLRLSQLQAFRDYYSGLAELDLRPGELSVLMLIGGNPGIRQGVLARKLMIKRAHMTKMVQGFEQAGLVRRTVPASDRRSIELWLTDDGAARIEAASGPFRQHEGRRHAELSDAEVSQLKNLLRKYLGLTAMKDTQ